MAESMTFAQYARRAMATAIYPAEAAGIYPALGVAAEFAELSEASLEQREEEIGDVLWNLAAWASDCGIADIDRPLDQFGVKRPPHVSVRDELLFFVGRICAIEARRLRDGEPGVMEISILFGALNVLGELARRCGTTLELAASANLAKLAGRAERGTLRGSGER